MPTGGGVNWPMAIFWLVALGGPYLIYKCVAKMVSRIEESRKWATGNGEHYSAQVEFKMRLSAKYRYYPGFQVSSRGNKVVLVIKGVKIAPYYLNTPVLPRHHKDSKSNIIECHE